MDEHASDPLIKKILQTLPSAEFRKAYKAALGASVDRTLPKAQLDELNEMFLYFKTDVIRLKRCIDQLDREIDEVNRFIENKGRPAYLQNKGDELPDWLKPGYKPKGEDDRRYKKPKFSQ